MSIIAGLSCSAGDILDADSELHEADLRAATACLFGAGDPWNALTGAGIAGVEDVTVRIVFTGSGRIRHTDVVHASLTRAAVDHRLTRYRRDTHLIAAESTWRTVERAFT